MFKKTDQKVNFWAWNQSESQWFFSGPKSFILRDFLNAPLQCGQFLRNCWRIICNCGGLNALNKLTLIFICPCIVVWLGNLPPPFILPPPFRIKNGGGRILNGGGWLNGGARFPNQTNPTYLNKKNKYLNKKTEY
jgi:hypothetical protein